MTSFLRSPRLLLASSLLAAGLLAAPLSAMAQASTPSSPAKKALVAKVVQLQQPGMEAFARTVVQQNTMQVLQAAGQALQQRVTPERREAVGKDIQADARKFAEEVFPIVRDRAVKLGPATIGPLLEERFNEDELKQLVGIMESPVGKKFASMNADMMRALAEKLMPEVRPLVDPKMQAFQQQVAARLAPPASAAGTGK